LNKSGFCYPCPRMLDMIMNLS